MKNDIIVNKLIGYAKKIIDYCSDKNYESFKEDLIVKSVDLLTARNLLETELGMSKIESLQSSNSNGHRVLEIPPSPPRQNS